MNQFVSLLAALLVVGCGEKPNPGTPKPVTNAATTTPAGVRAPITLRYLDLDRDKSITPTQEKQLRDLRRTSGAVFWVTNHTSVPIRIGDITVQKKENGQWRTRGTLGGSVMFYVEQKLEKDGKASFMLTQTTQLLPEQAGYASPPFGAWMGWTPAPGMGWRLKVEVQERLVGLKESVAAMAIRLKSGNTNVSVNPFDESRVIYTTIEIFSDEFSGP